MSECRKREGYTLLQVIFNLKKKMKRQVNKFFDDKDEMPCSLPKSNLIKLSRVRPNAFIIPVNFHVKQSLYRKKLGFSITT